MIDALTFSAVIRTHPEVGWRMVREYIICWLGSLQIRTNLQKSAFPPSENRSCMCVHANPRGGKARAVGRRFRAGRLPPPLSLSLSLSPQTQLHSTAPPRGPPRRAGGPLLVSGAYSVGRRRTNMRGARPAAPPKAAAGSVPARRPAFSAARLLPASMSDGRTFSDEKPIEAESEESVKSQ